MDFAGPTTSDITKEKGEKLWQARSTWTVVPPRGIDWYSPGSVGQFQDWALFQFPVAFYWFYAFARGESNLNVFPVQSYCNPIWVGSQANVDLLVASELTVGTAAQWERGGRHIGLVFWAASYGAGVRSSQVEGSWWKRHHFPLAIVMLFLLERRAQCLCTSPIQPYTLLAATALSWQMNDWGWMRGQLLVFSCPSGLRLRS